MLIPFEVLFRKYNIRPDGVLHIGANSGQEADEYDKFRIPKVVWIEALPDVFKKLVRHVAGRPGHLPLQACISDVDGDWIKFKVASNQGQSSSMLEFGTHSIEHPTVKFIGEIPMQTTRVDTLLRKHGIKLSNGWFLNIDLQGAELLALRGMGTLLDCFTDLYLEVNEQELYKGCPLVHELDSFLGNRGFRGMETKMTGSHWGDRYYRRV